MSSTNEKTRAPYLAPIYKVLKQVHPNMEISEKAISIIHNFLTDFQIRVTSQALVAFESKKPEGNEEKVLSGREIQTSTRQLIPGELAKHAVSEGTKAVTKVYSRPSAEGGALSERAGLRFPVGRVGRILKESTKGLPLGVGAAVYLAAVMEYLSAELLELSGNAAFADNKKKRIEPTHIFLAVSKDEELKALFMDEESTKRDTQEPVQDLSKELASIKMEENDADENYQEPASDEDDEQIDFAKTE
jgi:histone H2A